MPTIADAPDFDLSPDWVCEIISPSSVGCDRTLKLSIYLRETVPHDWIVDPVGQTLEVLRLDGDGYRIDAVHAGATTVRAQPFDAIELDLGALWLSEDM